MEKNITHLRQRLCLGNYVSLGKETVGKQIKKGFLTLAKL
jgi:hypothetical protein